jgi:hypothetical protein
MEHEISGLIEEGGRIVGVRVKTPAGAQEIGRISSSAPTGGNRSSGRKPARGRQPRRADRCVVDAAVEAS